MADSQGGRLHVAIGIGWFAPIAAVVTYADIGSFLIIATRRHLATPKT